MTIPSELLLLLVAVAYGLVYVLLEAGGEPAIERSDIDEHRSKPREGPTADERPQPAVRTAARAPTPAAARYVDVPPPEALSDAARAPPRQAAGSDVSPDVAPWVPREAARDLAAIAETAERGESAEAGGARARRRA